MLKILSSLLIFLSLASLSQAKIAIVDIESVLKNSKVMDHTKKTIEAKTASYQKIITNKEKSLESQRIKIENKMQNLAELAAKEVAKKFEKKVTSFFEYAQKKQKNLQTKTIEATNKIQDKITQIVQQIAKKDKFDLVIHKANTIYYDDKNVTDISSKVLKELDKKLSKLNIKF
jgi:outer membrane protein